jgi:hypothetical protein
MSAATFTREEMASYAKQESAPAATTDTKTAASATADDKTSAAAATNAATDVSDTATDSDIDLSPDSSPGEETDSTDSSTDGTSDENADSSTASAESQDGDTHTEGDGTGQPRSRARDRIEDLIAERNALKAYGKHLEARMEELAAKAAAAPATAAKTETASATVADKDDPAPTLAEHQYDPDAYAKANAAWLNRQVKKQVAEALQQKDVQATAEKVEARFKEQEVELRKTAKDYDIVIANPNLPKLAAVTAKQIVYSEAGPKLTYHLAKNPDLATRISRMAPEQQLVAIGRLEAQLTAPAAAATAAKPQVKKTVTKAPPPPTPASTGGQSTKSPGDMSMDEWVAHERSQKLAEREQKRKIRSANSR